MIPPTFEDVERAALSLDGLANRTPVFRSRTLDKLTGCHVLLKAESFQRGGAFKFRGAAYAISLLSEAERSLGVVTYSSGNHAGAVALAAQMFGTHATVVMPQDAPGVKIDAVRGYGATIEFYERAEQSREAIARDIAEKTGATMIPPYDDARIIAGQGTAALEFLRDFPELECLIVPCGGGGLISGSALSAKALSPGCTVIGVEPEAGDDAKRSLETGSIQTVDNPITIADGARTPSIGALNFAIMREKVTRIETVTDGQIVDAMKFLWERMKLVVEPTGALGLAALMAGKVQDHGHVGIILSGGNVQFPR